IALYHLAPSAFVQRELGIDEIAMVLDQPIDAVVRTAALFVRGECDDDIAIRLVAFAFVADQVGRPRGHLRLVIGGAAAIVKSVFFGENEWIQAPVFTL